MSLKNRQKLCTLQTQNPYNILLSDCTKQIDFFSMSNKSHQKRIPKIKVEKINLNNQMWMFATLTTTV
jgi:phage anti-repressor protein